MVIGNYNESFVKAVSTFGKIRRYEKSLIAERFIRLTIRSMGSSLRAWQNTLFEYWRTHMNNATSKPKKTKKPAKKMPAK
jgi:hypothetical protein